VYNQASIQSGIRVQNHDGNIHSNNNSTSCYHWTWSNITWILYHQEAQLQWDIQEWIIQKELMMYN